MQRSLRLVSMLVLIWVVLSALSPAPTWAAEGYRLTWAYFKQGFDTSPSYKWFYFAASPNVGDDGIVPTGQEPSARSRQIVPLEAQLYQTGS
jgi:hypothetical protein